MRPGTYAQGIVRKNQSFDIRPPKTWNATAACQEICKSAGTAPATHLEERFRIKNNRDEAFTT